MKITKSTIIIGFVILASLITACKEKKKNEKDKQQNPTEFTQTENMEVGNDKRFSLKLNAMQRNHQLKNMRDHLGAVQNIITLLSSDQYEKASEIAYTRLGSTTEMKLMCASFGDKNFETLGLEFHKSADEMSEIFKKHNKEESLKALSNTMNYCIQCHATYRQ